jgi:predicted P-loop ATPase/GTPase
VLLIVVDSISPWRVRSNSKEKNSIQDSVGQKKRKLTVDHCWEDLFAYIRLVVIKAALGSPTLSFIRARVSSLVHCANSIPSLKRRMPLYRGIHAILEQGEQVY